MAKLMPYGLRFCFADRYKNFVVHLIAITQKIDRSNLGFLLVFKTNLGRAINRNIGNLK